MIAKKRQKVVYTFYNIIFKETFATRMYKRGMDIAVIAKLLGHENVHTTQKYYLTICDNDVEHQYHKCV